jgi:(2Fe-2S) ferredoxin
MSKKDKQVSIFNLEGRFLGYLLEDGYKIKYLRLATAEGEVEIKLAKEARVSIGRVLQPGEWLQVWGEKTVRLDTEAVKLKAYKVTIAAPIETTATALTPKASAPAKATILVCQKSDCLQRGGKAVCQALETALRDRDLTDQVTVRGTGCMKRCKAGPNLVMPDKTRYSQVSAAEIPALIDKHISCDATNHTAAPERLPIHSAGSH